jgi:hypothetical protein
MRQICFAKPICDFEVISSHSDIQGHFRPPLQDSVTDADAVIEPFVGDDFQDWVWEGSQHSQNELS